MARLGRIVAPGHPHRAAQRGDGRQSTFSRDDDYLEYLFLMAESRRRCGTQVANPGKAA